MNASASRGRNNAERARAPKKRKANQGAVVNNRNNNGNNTTNLLNTLRNGPNTLPWRDPKLDVLRPYVQSAVQARQDIEKQLGLPLSGPRMSDVYLALAISTGATFITVGRGAALEDAPFVPGVAYIPTIPRALWSTSRPVFSNEEIMRAMPPSYWGVRQNIPRNFSLPQNAQVLPPNQSNEKGGIDSFYHPAFMQICNKPGEWLINGFKVNKQEVEAKAAARRINIRSVIGSGTKGPTQSESDMTKLTIYEYTDPVNGRRKLGLIWTSGEAKSGVGEAPGKKGAEVAQLRYTLTAVYTMIREIQTSPYYHPWKSISRITLEGCFIGAGAQTVYDTILTEQQENTTIPISGTIPIDIRRVNLPRFCAIFRLDRMRFAIARTGIVSSFKNKILNLYSKATPGGPANALPVTGDTLIPIKNSLQGYTLGANALAQPFRMAILGNPRNGWNLSRNLNEVSKLRNVANSLFIGGLTPGAPLSPADKYYLERLYRAYLSFWQAIIKKSRRLNITNNKSRGRNNYFASLAPWMNQIRNVPNVSATQRNNALSLVSDISARLGNKTAATSVTVPFGNNNNRTPGRVIQPPAAPRGMNSKVAKAAAVAASRNEGVAAVGRIVGPIKKQIMPQLRGRDPLEIKRRVVTNARRNAYLKLSEIYTQQNAMGRTLLKQEINRQLPYPPR